MHSISIPSQTIQIKDTNLYSDVCTLELRLSRQTVLGLADIITQLPVLAAQWRTLLAAEYEAQQHRDAIRKQKERRLRGLHLLSRMRKSKKRISDLPNGHVDAYWAERMRPIVRHRYFRRRNYVICARRAAGETVTSIAADYGLSASAVMSILKKGATK